MPAAGLSPWSAQSDPTNQKNISILKCLTKRKEKNRTVWLDFRRNCVDQIQLRKFQPQKVEPPAGSTFSEFSLLAYYGTNYRKSTTANTVEPR